MSISEKAVSYIAKHPKWEAALTLLRSILNKSELTEAIKWGAPAYTFNGKIVVGLAGFKNHAAIWFHQGVFLKDTDKLLVNAQEGKTKALRQWRIEKEDELKPSIIKKYIEEAIANSKAGKELKIERTKKVILCTELEEFFKNNSLIEKSFSNLTPGKKREYAAYIAEAKRAATKQSRLEKITPMIQKGIGLHDKYKNC